MDNNDNTWTVWTWIRALLGTAILAKVGWNIKNIILFLIERVQEWQQNIEIEFLKRKYEIEKKKYEIQMTKKYEIEKKYERLVKLNEMLNKNKFLSFIKKQLSTYKDASRAYRKMRRLTKSAKRNSVQRQKKRTRPVLWLGYYKKIRRCSGFRQNQLIKNANKLLRRNHVK